MRIPIQTSELKGANEAFQTRFNKLSSELSIVTTFLE